MDDLFTDSFSLFGENSLIGKQLRLEDANGNRRCAVVEKMDGEHLVQSIMIW